MMLAWLIAFFLSFTIDLGVSYGLGRHDADIPSSDWPTLRRCEYVFTILYVRCPPSACAALAGSAFADSLSLRVCRTRP